MNLLILGRGKTGSLVAEVAADRQHPVGVAGSKENAACAALPPEKLHDSDAVIDFSTPHVVLNHIEACVKAGKSMVVGTTGWYDQIDRIRALVAQYKTSFIYAGNFSIGVNLFYEAARAAAAALHHDYSGQIFERHHATKKDAPSGTAITIQKLIRESGATAADIEIVSFREGDV